MKNTAIPKKMRQQAEKRKRKPPEIMAQQAALNAVLLGRKGGAHSSEPTRQALLAQIKLKEAQDGL